MPVEPFKAFSFGKKQLVGTAAWVKREEIGNFDKNNKQGPDLVYIKTISR